MKLTILVLLAIFAVTGCASNQIMKECKPIDGTEKMVCKTTMPWESLD